MKKVFSCLLKPIKKIIKFILINVIRMFSRIDKNQIFFINFSGCYDCNNRAICDEFIQRNKNIRIVFALNKGFDDCSMPSEVNKVQKGTLKFYKELASSKVIIDNEVAVSFENYKTKRKQILIETWHGSIGIKKFGPDGNNDVKWFKKAKKEAKMTDYIISNSDFEDNVYKETFWKDVKIWKFGHPRNDILFLKSPEKNKAIRQNLMDKYGVGLDKKICLYAPTFRDAYNLDQAKLNFKKLKETLSKRFGGEWEILLRYHSVVRHNKGLLDIFENCVNVSDYPNIEDLMVVSDCGITDYSGWICEYILTKKPAFIFAYDYEFYVNNERKLYFSLDELPFQSSVDFDGLLDNILNFEQKEYNISCTNFIKKHGSVDDGQASKRVVDEVIKLMED